MSTSKSIWPFSRRWMNSSSSAISAPAARAFLASSSGAKTATRTVLPLPCGKTTVARMFWSAWRGSTPRRTWASTVLSKLQGQVSGASAKASLRVYNLPDSIFLAAAWYFLPRRSIFGRVTGVAPFGFSPASSKAFVSALRAWRSSSALTSSRCFFDFLPDLAYCSSAPALASSSLTPSLTSVAISFVVSMSLIKSASAAPVFCASVAGFSWFDRLAIKSFLWY